MKAFGVLFSLLTAGCLYGFLFERATHQLAGVIICASVALVCFIAGRRDKEDDNNRIKRAEASRR